jgi:murein DD-endopeptidase MepM/ murein hydrolase activator NlpD
MFKRIGFIFLLILVIAIGYDIVVSLVSATSSGTLSSFFPALTPLSGGDFGPGSGGAGGLTAINFDLFAKGGKGYGAITQAYGRTPYSYMYIGDWHNGIDIGAVYGAPIYSPAAATVLAVGNQDDYCPRRAFGRFIVLQDSAHHLDLLFAHLANIDVQPGQAVTKDQLIGTIGVSGDETGTHLHFSIFESAGFSMAAAHGCGPYPQGRDVDPLNYLGTVYE